MDLNSMAEESVASYIVEPPDTYEAPYKRAPIEIWEAIFSIAIESPLIPYFNDDIVDIYLLFSQQCASQRIHRRVEMMRTRLRLVCRSWDASLHDKGIKFAPRSLQGGLYQRFEAVDSFRCICYPSCLGSVLNTPTHFRSNRYSDPPASALDSLRVGIVDGKYPVNILLNAPRLQALHLACDAAPINTGILLTHHTAGTLSHLQLAGISLQSIGLISHPVKLPRLRTLSLKFRTDPVSVNDPDPSTSPLTAWLLPCLQTLKLEGRLHARDKPAIQKFLSGPWTGVTSLYVGLTYKTQIALGAPEVFEVTPTLWASFPNLGTFGAHAGSLVGVPPPPPTSYPQFSLVLEFMWDSGLRGFSLRGQSMIPFIQVLDEWKPVNIIFLSTWGEIHTNWKKSNPSLSMWPKGLFSTALARDIGLLDVNRTPMCDDDGLECLEIILG